MDSTGSQSVDDGKENKQPQKVYYLPVYSSKDSE